MNDALLAAYRNHASDLKDLLGETKDLASSDITCDTLLGIARDGLSKILKAIEPNNELALAMISDSENIECEIDQAEFLINVASAILNKLSKQSEFVEDAFELPA